jgi:MerR family mercuric resistance operon transcriptional regulator
MTYSIGELAQAAGVSVETLRFYERRGLMPEPPRTSSGYRRYGPDDHWRLGFVQRAKALGFRLSEIAALLGDGGARSVDEVTRIASSRLAAIERELIELTARRDRLETLLATCSAGSAADCLDLSPTSTCTA